MIRKFENMTDKEKLMHLKQKLDGLQRFLKEIQGSGRAYSSSVSIHASELEWIVGKMSNENKEC